MAYARDPYDTDEAPCFCDQDAGPVLTTPEFCPAHGDPDKPAPEPPSDQTLPAATRQHAEGQPTGPVFACTDCTWHSIPGEYPEAGACPSCGECVVLCQCEDWRFSTATATKRKD